MNNEALDLTERPVDTTINRTKQGLTWTTPQRKAVVDQFKKDNPENTQPVDRLLKIAMEKVLPRQLWRKFFSGNDPVKMMIHEMQGTEPRKDRLKSEAAKKAAITRRLGRMPARQAGGLGKYEELLTEDEARKIRPKVKPLQCPECAIGRDRPDGKSFRNIRKNNASLRLHRFKAHTTKGKGIARSAGKNFRRPGTNGVRRWKPWERKKEKALALAQTPKTRKPWGSNRVLAKLAAPAEGTLQRVENEQQAVATRIAPAKHPLLIRVVLDLSLAAAAQIVPPNE
jgi:hypothetical protein